jgi:hypothetical protein
MDTPVIEASQILARAKPDDCVVVALHGGGRLVIYTAPPDPSRLVDIARSLLVSARDTLDEAGDNPTDEAAALWAAADNAISHLPDPHADPEDG